MSNMVESKMVEANKWYKSKKGALIRVDQVNADGTVIGTSHFTGNIIRVSADEAGFFTPTDAPETAPGMMIVKEKKENNPINESTYAKYPHIIPGSIYRVKNIQSQEKEATAYVRNKKISIHGAIRCKIRCKCGKERDIKVQDAFQVSRCLDCVKADKKKKLDKMLAEKRKQ